MVLLALFWSQVRDDPSMIEVSQKNVRTYAKLTRSLQGNDSNQMPFIDTELSPAGQYVRTEVLYREALDFGLDKGDTAIKHRLAKKMYMYFLEIERNRITVSDQDILKYFRTYKEDYYIQPTVTFSHVFYSVKNRDFALAEELTNEKLYDLNEKMVTFAEAIDHGEKFAFQTNYVNKDQKFIAKHFGEEFAAEIFNLSKDMTKWFGPFKSRHGVHAVMVIDRTYGRYPRLEDIKAQVQRDTHRYKLKKAVDKQIAELQKDYQIKFGKDVPRSLTSEGERRSKPQPSKKRS